MLDELGPQSAAVKAALTQGPGTVDIESLTSAGKALADKVFAGGASVSAASLLAQKEAYDFVSAYSRVGKVLGLTRAQYYAAAPADQAAEVSRTTKLLGSLNSFARLGA